LLHHSLILHAAESWCIFVFKNAVVEISQGREFFRVSATEAIQTILDVQARYKPIAEDASSVPEHPRIRASAEAEGYLASARSAHYGEGDTFQDTAEAIQLYKLAEAHGAIEADYHLGCLYLDNGEYRDDRLALKHLKTAAAGECGPAYARLGEHFLERTEFGQRTQSVE
jgi:hypothetical protein